MYKKKIMLLGGNYFQMTATKAAKELGHYVISVDYLPDNPAHKFADEYYNVSTTDREAILELAKKLKVDGIVSYASDVSAPTAAYVSEKLGLPTNPYESVMILTHKNLFRPFLVENGFNAPISGSFDTYEKAFQFFDSLKRPVMVKPSDANGSKGVSKVYKSIDFEKAFNEAMLFSRQKIVVIEEFLQRKGHQIAGDSFIIDGEIVFSGFMSEHFDNSCNPLVPIGESYPAYISDALKQKAKNEINRLIQLLGMKFGAINMDFIIDAKGDVYIIEIGPRNGGNLITDIIREASGIDLAKCTVQAALGLKVDTDFNKPITKYISSYIVHSLSNGKYKGIDIDKSIKNNIILFEDFTTMNDDVTAFENAARGTGAMLMEFSSVQDMVYCMDNMNKFIKVKIE